MKDDNQKIQRITLFIKSRVVKHAKTQAIAEDLSLSNLTEKALVKYLPKAAIIKKAKAIKKALIGSLGILLIVFVFFTLFTFTVSACEEECPVDPPAPTEAPCPEECPCDEDCPVPTPVPTEPPVVTPAPIGTPEITPTGAPVPTSAPPSNNGGGGGGGGSPGGPAVCVASVISTVPIIIETKRIDANTIFVSWGPFAGFKDFVVEYGIQSGNFPYNTKVNGFSTNINSLPANQPVYIRVAATDNCAVGQFGSVVIVGKVPVLPKTGFAPKNKLSEIILPISTIGLLSLSLVLIKKKKIF